MKELLQEIIWKLQTYGVFIDDTKESGKNWLNLYPDIINFIDEENRGYMHYQLEYLSYMGSFCNGDYHFLKEMVLALRAGCNIDNLRSLPYLLIREIRLYKKDTGIDYELKKEDTIESIKLRRLQKLDKDPFYVWNESVDPTRIALTAYKAKAKGFSPYLIMGLFHPAAAENVFQCLCYSKKIGFDLEPYLLDPQNRYIGMNNHIYNDTYRALLKVFKEIWNGEVEKNELHKVLQVTSYYPEYLFLRMLQCLSIFKKASFVIKHIDNINAVNFQERKYCKDIHKAIMKLLKEVSLSDIMDILEHCYGYIINLEHLNRYKGLKSSEKKELFLKDFETMKPFLHKTNSSIKPYIHNIDIIFLKKYNVPKRYHCLFRDGNAKKILGHFDKFDDPAIESFLQYYVVTMNSSSAGLVINDNQLVKYYIYNKVPDDWLKHYYSAIIQIRKYDHIELFIKYMEKGYNLLVLMTLINSVGNDVSKFEKVLTYVDKEWSINFVCEALKDILPEDIQIYL